MSNQRSWILKLIGAVSIATMSTIAAIFISHKLFHKFYLKQDPWQQIHTTFKRNLLKKSFPSGIVRSYETNTYEANSPNEDNSSMYIYKNSLGELRFVCGIYDGHSTDACSKFCSEDLIAFIDRRLRIIEQYINQNKDDQNFIENYKKYKPTLIREALKHGFKDADELFICESILNYFKSFGSNFNRCISGSCCIIVLIEDNIIYTANVGDCRAVLGSIKGNKIVSKDLSSDHNTDNFNEIMRIKQEHKDENVIVNGRVKGILKPTRNIGDALLKEKIIEIFLQKESMGEPWNPPYVSSDPEITTHHITSDDKFIILASDGFWDLVSSQRSVELVVEYISKVNKGKLRGISVTTYLIERALTEIKVRFKNLNLSKEERDIELLSRVIELPLYDKRNIHDDITVSVIFLNKRGTTTYSNNFSDIRPKQPMIIDRIDNLKKNMNAEEMFSRESPETLRIKQYIKECWPKDLNKWSSNSCTIDELLRSYGIISKK